MTALFRKLESALVADIEIELPDGAEVEMYPYQVPIQPAAWLQWNLGEYLFHQTGRQSRCIVHYVQRRR